MTLDIDVMRRAVKAWSSDTLGLPPESLEASDVVALLDHLKAETERADAAEQQQADADKETARWVDNAGQLAGRLGEAERLLIAARAHVRELAEALEPFAEAGRSPPCAPGSTPLRESNIVECIAWSYRDGDQKDYRVMLTDFRRAARALAAVKDAEGGGADG